MDKLKETIVKAVEEAFEDFDFINSNKQTEKPLITPGGIVFYHTHSDNGIVYNNKVLWYPKSLGSWLVITRQASDELSNLPLTPTTFDKLDVGDVFFIDSLDVFESEQNDINLYAIKISDTKEIAYNKDEEYPLWIYTRNTDKTNIVLKVEFD